MFIEVNLRKCKLLLADTYHSNHPVYGTSDTDIFEQMGLAMDVYSNFDKFLLAGDFNVQVGENPIDDFLYEYGAKSLVKDFMCFKSTSNPSCVDLFVTIINSFQCTKTIRTGLSDFHTMIATLLKATFVGNNFYSDIEAKLQNTVVRDYASFHSIFHGVLNNHVPRRKNVH